jgi:hypothetical protein
VKKPDKRKSKHKLMHSGVPGLGIVGITLIPQLTVIMQKQIFYFLCIPKTWDPSLECPMSQ